MKNRQELEKHAAAILLILIEDFPGLFDDNEEVNGADLVDHLSSAIYNLPDRVRREIEKELMT